MAKLISDEQEFITEYKKSVADDLLLKLQISPKEATRWKENGNFKHIRTQLRQVSGLCVACQTYITPSGKHMYHYYFMCPSKDMMGRIYDMITEVFDNNNLVNLMDSKLESLDPQSGFDYSTYTEADMNPSCALV